MAIHHYNYISRVILLFHIERSALSAQRSALSAQRSGAEQNRPIGISPEPWDDS